MCVARGGELELKNLYISKDKIFDFKFSKSPYFVNHLSECNSTCTIDTM